MLLAPPSDRPAATSGRGRVGRWVAIAAVLVLAMVVVWLARRLDPQGGNLRTFLQTVASALAERPGGPLIAALGYAVAGVAFLPVTLLATVTLAVFGLWPGIAIAWTGGLASALLSHALGRALGPRAIAWLPERLQGALRGAVTRRAFWSVIVMRLAPVGNFGALNLLSGTIPLPWIPFALGNAVALLPGLLGLGVVMQRVRALIREPSATNVAWGVAALAVLVAMGIVVRKRVAKRPAPTPTA